MSRRLVSFLVPDIGATSVGAAVRMAHSLQKEFDVEIVGPDFGRGVNSMYRTEFPFRAIPCPRLYRLPDFWWESQRLERAISGEIIVPLKAYQNTIPIALRHKKRRGARVAVFLDEWDGGVLANRSPEELRRLRRKYRFRTMEDIHYPSVESRIKEADTVLSTTTFLQKRFGGHVISMGVDAVKFQPQPPALVQNLKRELGLEEKRVIVFGGVVRPHKGIEIIPAALGLLGDDSIRLLVVGPITEHLEMMMRDSRYAPWIQVAGAPEDDPQGINAAIHQKMPLYLDLADLIALPLIDTPLAQSQMPIKLFEAMAMGKPIIASQVADLPLVLKDCGRIVPPENVEILAHAIRDLLSDPARARLLGAKARTTCESRYSLPIVGERLASILRSL